MQQGPGGPLCGPWPGNLRHQGREGGPYDAWRGQTVTVIATGPSLTKDDAQEAVRESRVIAVNNAVQWAPGAAALYACDYDWWRHNAFAWRDFGGLKFTWCNEAARAFGLIHVPSEQGPGLGRESIRTGKNSGYQAINLAYLLGAARILLLGFDMQPTGGRLHCHADHRHTHNPTESLFRQWRALMSPLADDLASEGVEVINCTRQTALTQFRRAPLRAVL